MSDVPTADALLAEMTIEEKVGQMTQVTLQAVTHAPVAPGVRPELDHAAVGDLVIRRGIGSVLNVRDAALGVEDWRTLMDELQAAARSTRLAIPLLYGIDAVHGAGYTRGATLFPQSLSMAAAWDPDLVRQAASVTAAEIRSCGIPWNFAPVLDVGRHPLWSRFVETYGEDVLLTCVLGEAAIRGHADVDGVASCAKHFVGYSAPASGMDRTTAWLPDHLLREIYLPPFEAAVRSGVPSIMVNSGDVNGIPVHASRFLLTDVLRNELGFGGVVVTDWEDVVKLHTVHRVAPTLKDAVRLAVEAGIDISMTPYDAHFAEELASLVADGLVPEFRIDESVRRILRMKLDLGLFDRPVPDPVPGRRPGSMEHTALARRAARESIVLLENRDATLPAESGSRVLLAGHSAASRTMLLGPWTGTWQGSDETRCPRSVPTVEETFRTRFDDHFAGFVSDPEKIAGLAGDVDLVVACLGERPSVEKPGDRHDLEVGPAERRMAEAALATGRPVVLVLLTDRPLRVGDLSERASAVVWAGRPGMCGAEAIVDLLTGRADPEGRLPFTWPRHAHPFLPYDHRLSDRLGPSYGLGPGIPLDGFDPSWQFGHGLSYANIETTGVSVTPDVVRTDERIRISVSVANRGPRPGAEVIHVMVSDRFASVAPPVERLRAFRKIRLDPAEEATEVFELPVSDLAFHAPGGPGLEPGAFGIRVGVHMAEFTVV